MDTKPLSKIRVLDITQNICGPLCTQYLCDLGAEVIKIEPPEGDISRQRGITYGRTSLAYVYTNRGKKSVTLDITRTEHRDIFLKLAEKSDIVVEDLGAGKADGLGIGYNTIKLVKPDIVYISITDFGHTGSFSDYEGNDAILQAISGYMSVTSMKYNGPFTRISPPVADLMSGIYATIGAFSGLIHRKKTGESLYVDVAKLSCMLQCMPDGYAKYLSYGEKAIPSGNAHRMSGAYFPMPCKDGAVICNPDNRNSTEHKWEDFCKEIGISEQWYGCEKFTSRESRLANREEIEQVLSAHTKNFTSAELEEICRKTNVVSGIVNDMKQLAEDPQTQHDKIIISATDSKEGSFKVLGCPLKFSEFETREPNFVDEPGEHTLDVLSKIIGMSTEEIAALM